MRMRVKNPQDALGWLVGGTLGMVVIYVVGNGLYDICVGISMMLGRK